jgi:hypothetical protein
MYADASLKESAYNASAKDNSTHEESQLMLTAGTIQNNRIHPAKGRLNPELNSLPLLIYLPNTYTDIVSDS